MQKLFIFISIVSFKIFAINPDGQIGRIGLHLLPSYTKYIHDERYYYYGYRSNPTDHGFNGSYGFSLPINNTITTGFTYQMQRISDHSIFHTFLIAASFYLDADSILINPDGPIGKPIISPLIGMNAFVGTKGIVTGLNLSLPVSSVLTLQADYLLSRLSQDNIHSSGGGVFIHLLNKGILNNKANPDGTPGSINLLLTGHYQKYGETKGTSLGSALQIPLPIIPVTFNIKYDHIRQREDGKLIERDNTFGLGVSIYL